MKEIILSRGEFALVDDEDYEWLNQWKWYKNNDGYATRCAWIGHGYIRYYMHRVIMNTPKGMFTDHINQNRLDNRRSNLRVCNLVQNLANRPKNITNHSGAKGVSWHKCRKKWDAQIKYCGKYIHIGSFDSLEEASKAYQNKASELLGEFVYKGVV